MSQKLISFRHVVDTNRFFGSGKSVNFLIYLADRKVCNFFRFFDPRTQICKMSNLIFLFYCTNERANLQIFIGWVPHISHSGGSRPGEDLALYRETIYFPSKIGYFLRFEEVKF
jgi:hypothetical protein